MNGVHRLQYNDFHYVSIGEAGKSLKTRIWEHIDQWVSKSLEFSSYADHHIKCGHTHQLWTTGEQYELTNSILLYDFGLNLGRLQRQLSQLFVCIKITKLNRDRGDYETGTQVLLNAGATGPPLRLL